MAADPLANLMNFLAARPYELGPERSASLRYTASGWLLQSGDLTETAGSLEGLDLTVADWLFVHGVEPVRSAGPEWTNRLIEAAQAIVDGLSVWPEDDWYTLSDQVDLNLWVLDTLVDGQPYKLATLYWHTVDGGTQTDVYTDITSHLRIQEVPCAKTTIEK